MMRKLILLFGLFVGVISCSPKMYYWGKYDSATYKYNKNQTVESKEDLLKVYEDIIKNKKKGTRKEVPPGIYADYGYLLLQEGQIDKGKEMLEKEIAIYPESQKIVEYILNKI